MIDYYTNKYILGLTSLWLFIPFFYNIVYSNLIYIKFLLFITTSVSTIFWGFYSLNSLFHKLDNIFASGLFILLILSNNFFILPISCFIFYGLSCYFYKKNKNYGLICHLIFRFIGFWWTMLIFSNLNIDFNIFIFYSLFYCFHIFYMFKIISYKNQLQRLEEQFTIIYTYGIVQTIILLFILIFLHLFLIQSF